MPCCLHSLRCFHNNAPICYNNYYLPFIKARIVCQVEATDLNPDSMPGKIGCFERLDATECKNVKVIIKYKLFNDSPSTEMKIVKDKTKFFFNEEDITSKVKPVLRNGAVVPSREAKTFKYSTRINTCQQLHLAEMEMKLRANVSPAVAVDKCK